MDEDRGVRGGKGREGNNRTTGDTARRGSALPLGLPSGGSSTWPRGYIKRAVIRSLGNGGRLIDSSPPLAFTEEREERVGGRSGGRVEGMTQGGDGMQDWNRERMG